MEQFKSVVNKFNLILILLIFANIELAGQYQVISNKNKELVFETIRSYEIYTDKLKDGKYLVTREGNQKLIDTLVIGKLENGKRVGIWKYYEKDTMLLFQIFKPELVKTNQYDQGILISSRDLFLTDIETFYEGTAEDENQFWTKRIYRNDNKHIRIDTLTQDFITSKTFDRKGNLISLILYKQAHIEITEYHLNGLKEAEYILEKVTVNGEYDEIPNGVMKIWNSDGSLDKEVFYDMGIITKSINY